MRTWPSAANFVLMDIGAKHKELVAAMRARGVLLRDRSADPGCDGYVRITIGVEEHDDAGDCGAAGVVGGDWMDAERERVGGTARLAEGVREYE